MSFFALFSHRTLLAPPASAEADESLWAPPLDVYETATHVVLELELPGASPGDIRITSVADAVVIEGVKPTGVERSAGEVGRFLCMERASGPFRRRVQLPAPVDRERATARLRDGVLLITLPKVAP